MKKFLIVLLILLSLAGVGCSIYFFTQYKKTSSEKDVLTQQNAVLQGQIDAIGPIMTAYTVSGYVQVGNVIHEGDIVPQTIPESSCTDVTILNPADIVGKLYKVDIKPGTTLTTDMVMETVYNETVYERDLVFNFLPLGLQVGDFVNINFYLPYGAKMTIMPHKRVEQLVEDSQLIKVYLTEAEMILWESALRDKALYGDVGVYLGVDKYVEPGVALKDDIIGFYPVRREMESLVNLNPNFTNKKLCVNTKLREKLDAMLASVSQEVGTKLASGVSSDAGMINAARATYYPSKEASNISNSSGSQGMSGSDMDYLDLNQDVGELTDMLQGDPINKTDSYGNGSSVTEMDRSEVQGDPVFAGEDVIE